MDAQAIQQNVFTVPLGRCDVNRHVDRGIVAVACVERDLIKVWPLPVEQPCERISGDAQEYKPGRRTPMTNEVGIRWVGSEACTSLRL